MASNDLVKKKPVALEVATYERLSKLAAQLRIDNPGGGFVSMSTAVTKLLDAFDVINQLNATREEWVKRNPKDTASFVIEPGKNGKVQFWRVEEDAPRQERWTELLPPVSLHDYAANAEKNDPQPKTGWAGIDSDEFFREHGYRTNLEPENETE